MEEIKGELKEEISKEIQDRKSKFQKIFLGWMKDNYDKIFLFILIIAFIIRLYIFFKTMNQPLWWDAADYLATAKRWGLGLNIRDIWYYRRGFLFPLIGALFFKLGLGESGIRFLMILFSTGIIAVSYFIIRDMFNKKLALLTSIALTLSWIILFFSGRVLTDIPAAFLLLLSLFFFWKGYVLKKGNKFLYLFGLVFALAVLTRMQSLILAPPFLIYIFIKERSKIFKNKHLWITLGIFLLFLLPHFVVYSMHYGNPLSDITHYYLKIGDESAVAQHSFKIFQYFMNLDYMISWPILIMFFFGIIYFLGDLFLGFDKLLKDEKLQSKLFIILWIFSLFFLIGYLTAHGAVEQRYIISGLPFLFLIAVSPLLFLENLFQNYIKNKKLCLFLIIVVLLLFLIPNILLANSLIKNKQTSYLEVKQMAELIKENSNPDDIVISTSLPQMTYYSERSTYPYDVKDYLNKYSLEDSNYSEGEKGFNEFLLEKKPKFLMASIFESDPEWILSKGQQDSFTYMILPFFNSSVIFDYRTNQMVSVDLKGEIEKDNGIILNLVYPQEMNQINGIFVYKVEYK